MKHKIICFAAIIVSLAISSGLAADNRKTVTLTGWAGIDGNSLDKFMADAEAVGFDVLITGSTAPVFLKKVVESGKRHNIKIFSWITPTGGLGDLWNKRYPERPVPWQSMTEDEEAARKFIMAGKSQKVPSTPARCRHDWIL